MVWAHYEDGYKQNSWRASGIAGYRNKWDKSVVSWVVLQPGWWVLKITLNYENFSLERCLISKQVSSILYFTEKCC